jgi:predicted DNA binding protein
VFDTDSRNHKNRAKYPADVPVHMREFAFTLSYDRGVDPVMDVFMTHESLVAKAVSISVWPGGLWRVDRLSGDREALDAVADAYLDATVCNECAAPHDACDAARTYEVIAEGSRGQTVYSYHEQVTYCHSIPFLAANQLGPGLLFDSERRGDHHEWRVLMRDDSGVGELYDAIDEGLPAGVSISLRGLTTPERWGERTNTVADLPPEQRRAIETAVAMGYYRTPRGAKLADIAARLDVPESTLRYRLRRAEAWLTANFVDADAMMSA